MGIVKNLYYSFKSKMTGRSKLTDLFISPDRFGRIDQLIAEKVVRAEHDDLQQEKNRKKYLRDVILLKKTLLESDNSSKYRNNLPKELGKETKEYANAVHKELKDIIKIIELCTQIIENEHLSVMHDIRRPITLFNEYQKALTDGLKDVAIDNNISKEIINQWSEILKKYSDIIDSTIQLCKEDQNIIKPQNLTEAIMLRTKAKRQLSGKTLSLRRQIRNLEKYFRRIREEEIVRKEKKINVAVAQLIEKNLAEFNNLFSQLMNFCSTRINASHNLILEAKLLQIQKLEELSSLDKEITDTVGLLNENSKAYAVYNSKLFNKTYGKSGIMLLSTYKDQVRQIEAKDQNAIKRDVLLNRYEITELNTDKSKLYSELNASIEKIKHSNSLMDKFRSKIITWVVLGSVVANIAGPFIKVVSSDKEGDRVVIVGSAEQIYKTVNESNAQALPISAINQSILVEKDSSFSIQDNITFEFAPKFIVNTSDSAAIAMKNNLINHIAKTITYNYNEALRKAKLELRKQLEKEDFTADEIDALLKEAAIIETDINNLVISSFTDIFGNSKLPIPNNKTLSVERGTVLFDLFISALEQVSKSNPELQKVIAQFMEKIILEKINIIRGMGANGKDELISSKTLQVRDSVTRKAVTEMNHYIKGLDSSTINNFFNNPDFARYKVFSGNSNNLFLNYEKVLNGTSGDEESLKVDMVRDIIKSTNEKEYKKIIKLMEPLRNAELVLDMKINIKILGSEGKIIPVPMIPFVDMPYNDKSIFSTQGANGKKHVPLKTGTVDNKIKGYNPGIFKNRPKLRSNNPTNPRVYTNNRKGQKSYIKL